LSYISGAIECNITSGEQRIPSGSVGPHVFIAEDFKKKAEARGVFSLDLGFRLFTHAR
jgi:hypothetical protein